MPSKRAFGNIRPRKRTDGRTSYQASFIHPDTGKRVTKTFRVRSEACAWLKEIERSVIRDELYAPQTQPEEQPQQPLTIEDYAQSWIGRLETNGASPNSFRSYISPLRRYILPNLGNLPLDQLSKADVRTWYDRLDPSKPGARRNAYRTLSALYTAAVDDDLVAVNPVHIKGALARLRVRDENRERVATSQQVDQIAEGMPPEMAIAVYVAAWAGLRYSEIAALRRKHVDMKNGVIKVRAGVKRKPDGGLVEGPPKSAMGVRDVPIAPRLKESLIQHLNQYVKAGRESLLVHSPADPEKYLSNKSLHTRYNKACAAAGLDGFGFHQLRATCATWLMRSGATPAEIQAILGHSDWATSQLYQRAPRERLREVMGRLSD